MPKNKIRRDFLVAASDGWYQAISEKAANKVRNAGQEVRHVEAPLKDCQVLSSSDFYNLTHLAVQNSADVRRDLANALAENLVQNPSRIETLIKASRDQEAWKRYLALTSDEGGSGSYGYDMYQQMSGDKNPRTRLDSAALGTRLNDHDYLRSLPAEHYREKDVLEIQALTEKVDLAAAMQKTLQAGISDKDKQEKLTSLLMWEGRLPADDLVRWADICGFHYGDPPNDWDGPSKEEMEVYFDISASVREHWQDMTTKKGQTFDALSIGKNSSSGKVFITRQFVDDNYGSPAP